MSFFITSTVSSLGAATSTSSAMVTSSEQDAYASNAMENIINL